MKTQSPNLFRKGSKPISGKIVPVVDEPVVLEFEKVQHKIFSAVELWNIQRRKRHILIR